MVCLVTGASRGLGRAAALSFGSRGHKVAVHFKERKAEAGSVAANIKESLIIRADVRNYRDVKTMVDRIVGEWGRLDVLINNAGITKESLLVKTSEQDFDEIINTNLKGPFHLVRAAGRQMMKQKSGHIINISSYTGLKGREGLAAYSAAKAGLLGLTKTAAEELNRYNIMVNAVLPGYMLTDMGKDSSRKAKEKALKDSLIKEYSDPDSVADFIYNLTETKGVTGQVFNLDSRII